MDELDCSGSGYRQLAGSGFHEMMGISTIFEDLIASKEGLRCKGLVCTEYYLENLGIDGSLYRILFGRPRNRWKFVQNIIWKT
jgi:hypothetical protein